MFKVVAVWSGWAGAPGFSNFYFNTTGVSTSVNVTNAQARVKAFLSAISTCIPSGVSISINQDSQVIEPGAGTIDDTLNASTAQTVTVGAGPAFFSAVSGACVIWKTNAFLSGRQVRGKTFVVPMANSAYDSDGTILAGRLADLRVGALGLAVPGSFPAAEQLVVWHRPVAGAGGQVFATATSTVNDRVSYLRSRRA